MSYKAMLKHRITILRQTNDVTTGSPVFAWQPVKTNVPCWLDLNFIRTGKDPMWTPEAGRSTERTGVLFVLPSAPLKNGDWIKCTKGPEGIFSLEAAIDEAWRPSKLHHLEISIKEVPQQIMPGSQGAPLPPSTTPIKVPTPAEVEDGIGEWDDIPGMDM